MIVWQYYVTFGAGASTSAGISKTFSGAIDDTIEIIWHQCQCQWHHMTEKSCCTSFQSSLPQECNGAKDYTISSS